MMYQLEVDNEDLLLAKKGEIREVKGHKIIRKGKCLNSVNKYCFPQMVVDFWNGLTEQVIEAERVCQMKKKLDMYRYGEMAT